MSTIGHGYGSEWHLLRWMGRHRSAFNQRVLQAVGQPSNRLEWLDWRFSAGDRQPDVEPKGLEFLPEGHQARTQWTAAWPQTGNVPNWDAVGQIIGQDGTEEWLLVEAKAHLDELRSSCAAKPATQWGGREKIDEFMEAAKADLGVRPDADWLKRHYQCANRIATLSFLHRHGVAARLLFIYFTGETHDGWDCPTDPNGWVGSGMKQSLPSMKRHLGIPTPHPTFGHVHDLFLPVAVTAP